MCSKHPQLEASSFLQSVKAEGGLLQASDEFGAEWKHAAGAPKKKDSKQVEIVGTAVPSVHLRVAGEYKASMIATWCLNASRPGADMVVCFGRSFRFASVKVRLRAVK